MSIINITEKEQNQANLYYLQSSLSELLINTRCGVEEISDEKRIELKIN